MIISLATVFFLSIASLHSFLVESEEEVFLRNENQALDKHYALVRKQYEESELQLKTLAEKDKLLKASLFNSLFVKSEVPEKQGIANLAVDDVSSLRKRVSQLSHHTHILKDHAAFNSHYFLEKVYSNKKKALLNLRTTPSILPVTNGKLISGFGKRIHPFHKGLYNHPGIDIAATRGTEVMASADGYISDVSFSDLLAGFGNQLEVTHNNELVTRYAHLENIVVKRGQRVKKGQVIGTVGNSGGSIAPHLHYEVLKKGEEQNPIHYLLQNISPAEFQQLYAISKKQNQSLD
jgi:murein DD-endopeptidase MepM/ murein hydrolase activator NlpD